MSENTPIKISKVDMSLVWGGVFDKLKIKESIDSDTELAKILGVTRGYISSVRLGRKGLSLRLAEEVFKRLGKIQDSDAMETLGLNYKIRSRFKNLCFIRQFVIKRANGFCQLCDNQAPFLDRDEHPYLEIHSVEAATEGGTHTPDNLVALCPNCNRKLDINPSQLDEEKLRKILKNYQKHDVHGVN